ncbi:pyocin activator PrtN family protein [Paraburkholderia phosphatilytica]|uniref:pyocin activator PrtN family protein n=1 Tax=Paraburkholderia phosphatilytica TaxID=2282883 RepID=UPI000E494FB0|nr:pyocin activator PrtN family protein [Paraburkholderia phosphatilytica]
MNTQFLLMAQFNGRAVVPLDEVRAAYFPHLDAHNMTRKINRGEIALPVMRADKSAKTARGVHIADLAAYIDAQRAAAVKECNQLCGIN